MGVTMKQHGGAVLIHLSGGQTVIISQRAQRTNLQAAGPAPGLMHHAKISRGHLKLLAFEFLLFPESLWMTAGLLMVGLV